MASEKFRRQLRQEAETWWQEGLIESSLYEKLAERYRFQSLEHDAKNQFVVILLGLGGILLGLGVITYVAANWQGWPREFRTLLLFALFVSVNAVGFYLWRRSPSERLQKLGHSLLLLGALILGANMGLMSQMFHQSGNLYELYAVWGLGVAVMAYGLRLASLGMLSLILMGIGYWLGVGTWITGPASPWQVVIEQMPLVLGLIYLPLAYRCRSRALFGLTAAAVVMALLGNLGILVADVRSRWLLATMVALPGALLWGYSDRLWRWGRPLPAGNVASIRPESTKTERFRPISRALAVIELGVMFYSLSFHWIWRDRLLNEVERPDSTALPMLISVVVLALVALLGWVLLTQQGLQRRGLPEQFVNSGAIATALILSALTLVAHEAYGLPVLAPLLFNLLLFLLSLGLLRDGLAVGSRGIFWGGMVLLVLSILTRMLEYNTDLLLKALVFALCGVGIIVAGLWFERRVVPGEGVKGLQSNFKGDS